MRVLTVTGDVPWPPVGGARTRNAHLAEALAQEHEVVVAALDWGGPAGAPPGGMKLHRVPWRLPTLLAAADAGDAQAWEAVSAPGAEPYGAAWYDSPDLEQLLHELCAAARPDVAVLTETAMARFRHCLPPDLPFVLDLHDVQSVKHERAGAGAEVTRLRRFESAAASAAAVTVCVSDLEAAAARAVLGAPRVEVVPNGVDTGHFLEAAGPGEDDRLVFTGSLHTEENADAVVWFVERVLPLLRARRPGVQLDVVGARPREDVLALVAPGVTLHADVPDTLPYLHRAGVAVVPLLRGGGTRLKVLEAASSGRSVVTTSVGCEGLGLRDAAEVDIANDAESFAAAVLRLCADPELRLRRGRTAREAAGAYDWSLIGHRWRSVVESVA